mgnify:CR=1 FL=1
MRKKIFLAFISLSLSLFVAVLAVLWLAQSTLEQKLNITAEQSLSVPAGATPVALLQELEQQGVIQGSIWLRLMWRLQQQHPSVQIGEYSISPHMSLADMLEKWRLGDVQNYRITLVEGWNFAQFRQALAQQELLEHTIGELTDDEIMQRLGKAGVHPEGRFYPDTYFFTRGQQDLELLRQANQRLEHVLAQEWEQRAADLPYANADEALIMASIIEKETGAAHERSEIAGVFVRRLKRNMLLQTDPTVIYGMGERYKGKITRADLRRPTPYNTYVHAGLPPTPIAMVGREAIAAALNPKSGNSLYFVAKGDGTHAFSPTLREHNRAVRKYQLKRRADYRSTVAPNTQTKDTP